MVAVEKNWVPAELDEAEVSKFVTATGLDPRVARLLLVRGVKADDAARFMAPRLADLPDPSLMKGLDRAALRLADAIVQKEAVALYGDYDVDGVTSSSLLAAFLESHGLTVRIYIPKRLKEGYGLNPEAVDVLASEGTKLLITLDCGITAADEITRANQHGIETIVVDHHRCPAELPPAYATLNPHQDDCTYPDDGLAAVGVCFNLVVGVRRVLRERGHYEGGEEPDLKRYLDLVAVGTIADMVPLTGVNRILAWHGLEELRLARRPGLRALMEVSSVKPARLSSSDVGYKLGPRINAAGRLDDASVGTRLILSKSIDEARPHAATLDVANRQRQKIELDVFQSAVAEIDAMSPLPPAIVLFDPTWHPGVVGICCSKLVERYARPAILIGEGGRGSARTAGAFHLYDAISRVSHHLRKFGGHRAAAGMTIDAEAFPAFKADFLEEARRGQESILGADVLVYDEQLEPADIDDAFADSLALLAPFGNGNPEPLFMVSKISVKTTKVVGKGHLKLRFLEGPKGGLEGIAFQKADLAPGLEGQKVELACHVERNEWNGNEYLSMRVRDLRVLGP